MFGYFSATFFDLWASKSQALRSESSEQIALKIEELYDSDNSALQPNTVAWNHLWTSYNELNAITTPVFLPPHALTHKKPIVEGSPVGCQKPSKAILTKRPFMMQAYLYSVK